LDVALRRRFAFVEVMPNPALLDDEQVEHAETRNLIGTTLTKETNVEQEVDSMKDRSADPALRKKLAQAWKRFGKETRRRKH
jgi:hypothetical protein